MAAVGTEMAGATVGATAIATVMRQLTSANLPTFQTAKVGAEAE
jgi:hypothetical protein